MSVYLPGRGLQSIPQKVRTLLENAIHGCVCSGSRKKKIMVRILTKAERLVIVIQNTCSEELKFDLQDGADKKGIGLASIIRSAEKYGGAADFKSNNGIFTSRIVL